MAENSTLPSADVSFKAYKESLKTFLKQQNRFSDFNFEGSNLSAIIDLLTFNTNNIAFMFNQVSAEAYGDSATLRASLVSKAKELNYTPRSRISSTVNVTVEIVPTDTPASILIPRGTKFRTTNIAGTSLTFVTTEAHTLQRNLQGRYVKSGITIREGEVVTEVFDVVSNTDRGFTTYDSKFILRSDNVDATSIEVEVLKSDNDLSPVTYTRAYNLYGLNNTSKIFFVRGHGDNQYECEFGDGTFGTALATGSVVRIKYRDTVGENANGRLGFSKVSAIQGYSSVTVVADEYAYGGAERESNESIRYNMTRHYQTLERGVIDSDFSTLLVAAFPEVQDSHVYGGEKIKRYGSVVVAVKSKASNGKIPSSLKKRIKNYLESKTLTTSVIVQDPVYFVVKIDTDVTYDTNLTQLNSDTVKSNIIAALETHEETNLNKFGTTIYGSKLETVIESADVSILGCQASLSLVFQWTPISVNVDETLTIAVGNQLNNSTVSSYAVQTGEFNVLDSAGIEVIPVIVRDDRQGVLQMIRTDTNSLVNSNVGTVDYTTGTISTNLKVQGYQGSAIDWTILPLNRKISIDLNQYAVIDAAYININLSGNSDN